MTVLESMETTAVLLTASKSYLLACIKLSINWVIWFKLDVMIVTIEFYILRLVCDLDFLSRSRSKKARASAPVISKFYELGWNSVYC